MTGVDTIAPGGRGSLLGGIPERGVWTALGLRRGQFLAILGGAVLVFLFLGGPVWRHVHDGHFARIVVSYAVIPPAVWVALRRNGSRGIVAVGVAATVLALIKLVVTAGLLAVLARARA
jgi:hypothetical protein